MNKEIKNIFMSIFFIFLIFLIISYVLYKIGITFNLIAYWGIFIGISTLLAVIEKEE